MVSKGFLKRSYSLVADFDSIKIGRQGIEDQGVFVQGTFPEEFGKIIGFDSSTFRKYPIERCEASTTVGLAGNRFQTEFSCGPFDCAAILSKDPRLVIEISTRQSIPSPIHLLESRLASRNGVIGVGSVSLSALMEDEAFQSWTSVFKMAGDGGTNPLEICQVLFKADLKDLGVRAEDAVQPASTSDLQKEDSNREEAVKSVMHEMELWKREETERHLQHLKHKEIERMKFLEEEWRKHEQQREKEISLLKSQLTERTQKAISILKDSEEREKKVTVLQESLLRRRKDLERQHLAKLQETEDSINRLQVRFRSGQTFSQGAIKRDFEHHLALEREKLSESMQKNVQMKQSVRSAEGRVEVLEQEILSVKKSDVKANFLVLQQELEGFKKMHATAQQRISILEQEKDKCH